MTFVTGWSWYWWNWYNEYHSIGMMATCWFVGGWGLFWDNDMGYEMAACQKFLGPTKIVFPLRYMSVFEDPKNEDPSQEEAAAATKSGDSASGD